MEDKFILGGKEFHSRFIMGSGKYKMKAVKTTEKQEYLFEYSCFFFKNSISFSK